MSRNDETSQWSRENFLKIVSHVYGPDRAMEVRHVLPDPVDLDGDATLLARLGLTMEDFTEAEGISP
jgi:hypothetical protein